MDWSEFQLILDSVIRVVREEKESVNQESQDTPIDPEARAQELSQV